MTRERDNLPLIHSLGRLALGTMLLTYDQVEQQIRGWEQEAERLRREGRPSLQPRPGAAVSPDADSEETIMTSVPLRVRNAPPAEAIRYTLIGMLTDMQQRTGRRRVVTPPSLLDQATHAVQEALEQSETLAPVRQQFHACATRGEAEVARWMTIGYAEEQRSREFARLATQMAVEDSFEQVVQHPQVQVLVQQQSAGLLAEMVSEVRERAVSIDILIERFFRRLFRRRPREVLPPPPSEVRSHAIRHVSKTEIS
jgi:hypothetical protein